MSIAISRDTRRWIVAGGVAVLLAIAAAALIELATHVVGPKLLTHYDGLPALAHAPSGQSIRMA
jgi:hypothetical protein